MEREDGPVVLVEGRRIGGEEPTAAAAGSGGRGGESLGAKEGGRYQRRGWGRLLLVPAVSQVEGKDQPLLRSYQVFGRARLKGVVESGGAQEGGRK
jgi:hypothetical protein